MFLSVDATADAPVARALTEGPWEVQSVDLSADRSTFFITSNEVDLGERHMYSLPAGGGARTRLTLTRGGHEGEVSPDGTRIALISSTANTPPDLWLLFAPVKKARTDFIVEKAVELGVAQDDAFHTDGPERGVLTGGGAHVHLRQGGGGCGDSEAFGELGRNDGDG